ncbi:hypothetical protein AN957_04435 [Cytobacillus solani]|uniref:Uncharacterized protein n=1 Tax=Cytobacillus solani TaxID=1637975 RepID=A0A0Q3QJF3_9BACI|nr:hypothetical protein AMS60_24055 [Bacillus sp. FJAT-21945]KQL17929.1 hypothetical protein AN957_04435 [Cytobacillus solani]
MELENCLGQASYLISNFRSPPYDKSTSIRYRLLCLLYLSRGPSSLYGDDQGASAFLILNQSFLMVFLQGR